MTPWLLGLPIGVVLLVALVVVALLLPTRGAP